MKMILGILVFGVLVGGLAASVHADAFLVDPVVQKAKPHGELDVGSISPGEKLEVIFSTDSGYGKEAQWLQARLGSAVPGGNIQSTNSGVGTKSLITSIQTSAGTQEGDYSIPLTLTGEDGVLQDEPFTIRLGVKKELVHASLSATQISGGVNQVSVFSVLLGNDSSASVPVRVEPALPFTWSAPRELVLKPHTFERVDVQVTPRFAGPKTFDIVVRRTDKESTLDTLKGTVVANPTLKDRYAAGLYGFPFFSISLAANYLLNALGSLLL